MDRPPAEEIDDSVIPVPLVIAVSGHRNLVVAEIPEIGRLTREFLETTRAHSGETSAAVLTPLAEGSGQLVAREALRLGLQLIIPMPMRKDLYRQGLASDAVRREFDQGRFRTSVCFGRSRPSLASAALAHPCASRHSCILHIARH